jgi:tRNA A37 methylthiotransferase MiaB
MPGQHPNAVKEDRSARAIAVAEELSVAYREGLIGAVQQVLFEQQEGQWDTGHAPNYVKVYVPYQNLHGQIHAVKITKVHEDGVEGQLI